VDCVIKYEGYIHGKHIKNKRIKEQIKASCKKDEGINVSITCMCNGKELRSECEDQSQAKIKEDKVIERLKRHEFPKMQGPEVKTKELTGEQSGFFMKKMAEEDYLEVSFLICICALKEARNCKGHLQIFLQIWPCQIEWWEEPCSKVPSYFIEGRTVCSQKLRAGYVVEKEGACWCCSFQHYQLPKISSFQMLMVFVQSVF
jgi:hypothetical protein